MVVGAGIVGICTAYFLQKSGFKVTIIDKEDPGTMTSYGHACTFADYASIPVNSPSLFRQIPSMLFKKDSPLAVDFFYVIKHLPWALKFLNNCRKDKVEEISKSLANFLKHAQLSYDEIFEEVKVSEYIKNEENIYLFDSKKSYDDYKYATLMRKRNNVEVARECAKLARSILGGNGITADYPIMRHMMNIESVYTYEGTHEMHTLILGHDITGIPSFK